MVRARIHFLDSPVALSGLINVDIQNRYAVVRKFGKIKSSRFFLRRKSISPEGNRRREGCKHHYRRSPADKASAKSPNFHKAPPYGLGFHLYYIPTKARCQGRLRANGGQFPCFAGIERINQRICPPIHLSDPPLSGYTSR